MLNFQEIIGHDQIKEHFQKAIEYNKVSHAYPWPMHLLLPCCARREKPNPVWNAMPANRY